MNNHLGWKVRGLLTLVLSVGLSAPYAVAQTAPSATPSAEEEIKLEAFSVTGSRIKRLDVETPQPVVAITAADMEMTGFSTVADVMRSLPFNSGQSLTPVSSGTSFTPGVNTVNLRGLGNNNVLVLINGRRSSPFGSSGFDGFQSMFDLNSIPLAAIESIEVLKDGGSAIYGSDAVSGVINVTLKKDYAGGNISVNIGNTIDTDSFEKGMSLTFGAAFNKTSIITTVDWYERNAIFARDMKFSSSTDLRDIGGINRSSSAGFPGLVFVPGVGYRTFLAPTTNPTVAAAVPFGTANGDVGAGLYNFLKDSDMFPEQRMLGFYTSIQHEITSRVSAYAELTFRRAETKNAAAATPMFGFNEQGYEYQRKTDAELEAEFGAGTTFDARNRAHYGQGQIDLSSWGIIIPAYNPFNPWGVALRDDNRVRFVESGPRINDVTSDTPRVVLGLTGDLDFVEDTWSWDASVTYAKTSTNNTNPGGHQDRLVQDAFHGVTFGAGTPEEVTLFLNPFGPSDPRIREYTEIRNPVSASYQTRGWTIGAGGEVFNLPAGAVGVAVGAEFRNEELKDYRTALNETGQIVGGSEGSSIFGSRDVYSAYVEFSVPVIDQVELQLAARYEDYSDFGTTTKPKVAIKVRPHSSLILRASYGESFLAPNLPYLYSSQSTSFSAAATIDPRRPNDQPTQIKQVGGGNPNLQPEETETTYVGFVYEPPFLRGLDIGVDYFRFDSTDLITRFTAAQILAGELAGDPAFTSLVVRNPPTDGSGIGTIQFVQTAWTNAAVRKYQGYDFNIRYQFDTNNLGRFRLQTSATYLDELSFGGPNNAGTRLLPRTRGNFTAAWSRGDWAASLFVNYIGYRYGTGQLSGTAKVTNDRYSSQVIVNPQVSYSGLFRTKLTLGVRNVLDRDPPLDYGEAERWTPGVNNPEPLFWYLRASREF
jgi:iron complex outermembrane receptor protein